MSRAMSPGESHWAVVRPSPALAVKAQMRALTTDIPNRSAYRLPSASMAALLTP